MRAKEEFEACVGRLTIFVSSHAHYHRAMCPSRASGNKGLEYFDKSQYERKSSITSSCALRWIFLVNVIKYEVPRQDLADRSFKIAGATAKPFRHARCEDGPSENK